MTGGGGGGATAIIEMMEKQKINKTNRNHKTETGQSKDPSEVIQKIKGRELSVKQVAR